MRSSVAVSCLSLLLAIALAAPPAAADDVITVIVKKEEKKRQTHWTLEEWLETRDRMRLMDLWLALHSGSPYEYYVGGDYQWGNQGVTSQGYTAFHIYGAAYASIFGLQLERTMDPVDETLGLMDLRIFGYHQQSTNITLQGGIKATTPTGTSYRQAVAGVAMSIYMSRYIGVEGLYRHSFDSTPNSSGFTVSGNRWEGGAFIDFKALRVYGTYYNDAQTTNIIGAEPVTRSGVLIGGRLYF